MSSLTIGDRNALEKLFRMSGGYVLNFSDPQFQEFIFECSGLDVHDEKYRYKGTSKAKKLRSLWEVESDPIVGNVILRLIEHFLNSHPDGDSAKHDLAEQCRLIGNRLVAGRPSLNTLKEHAKVFNATYLAKQIQRMEAAVEKDPALAIGTAKEMIETCCKTILQQRGKSVSGSPDISTLTKETLKELKLVPEGIPDKTKGADIIKRLLSNLGAIGNGLAELRNLYGTGHGKDGKAAGLTPRHAKLAVGSAATLVNFLFETHKETKI